MTSWPDIGRVAAQRPDRLAMSTGRTGGPTRSLFRYDPIAGALLDAAARVPPQPGFGDFRPDQHTAQIALRYLETRRPRFLFVALGEPDEYAHQGNYRGYLAALRHADRVVGELARALSERAAAGSRTALFVTADHGRARDFVNHGAAYPESARVWLLAWGTAFSARGILRQNSAHRLADLAPTLRSLLGLPGDRGPGAGRAIGALVSDSLGTPL